MMLSVTERAAEKLREEFLREFAEADVGFRVIASSHKPSQDGVKIKMDRQHENDRTIDLGGVKLFVNSSIVKQLHNYQLVWWDEPQAGFYLEMSSNEDADRTTNDS